MNKTYPVIDALLSEILGQTPIPSNHPFAHYLILLLFTVLCAVTVSVSTRMFAIEIKARKKPLSFHTEHTTCENERNVLGPMFVGVIAIILLFGMNLLLVMKYCPDRIGFVFKGSVLVFCLLLLHEAFLLYKITDTEEKGVSTSGDSSGNNRQEEFLGTIVSFTGSKPHPSILTKVTVHYKRKDPQHPPATRTET